MAEPFFSIASGGAKFIEFRRISGTDNAAVGDKSWEFISKSGGNFGSKFTEIGEIGGTLFQKRGAETLQKSFYSGDDLQRTAEILQIARGGDTDIQAADDTFKIADNAQTFAQFDQPHRIEDEIFHSIQPADDLGMIAQRAHQKTAEFTSAHRSGGMIQHTEQRALSVVAEK